jgi:hypothetical protein
MADEVDDGADEAGILQLLGGDKELATERIGCRL